MPRDKDGLTPKQRRFVVEYLKDSNAAQAYIRAGYSRHATTANTNGPRLLGNARLVEVLERERKALEAKKFLSIERMEAELDALIHFDPATMYDEHGNLLPVTDMPERTRKALVGIEQEELWEGRGDERMRTGDLRKVKWHNKREAIELGFKRRGALVDRHEHAGPNGEPLATSLEVRFVTPAKAGVK